MGLGLAQGDADTEDGALAIRADAHGDEGGAVHENSAVADLFISGVHDEVGEVAEWPLAPKLQFDVESGGAGAHLGGADLMAAEFLHDLGYLSG